MFVLAVKLPATLNVPAVAMLPPVMLAVTLTMLPVCAAANIVPVILALPATTLAPVILPTVLIAEPLTVPLAEKFVLATHTLFVLVHKILA
jgi:hypothetical protein